MGCVNFLDDDEDNEQQEIWQRKMDMILSPPLATLLGRIGCRPPQMGTDDSSHWAMMTWKTTTTGCWVEGCCQSRMSATKQKGRRGAVTTGWDTPPQWPHLDRGQLIAAFVVNANKLCLRHLLPYCTFDINLLPGPWIPRITCSSLWDYHRAG